MTRLMPQTNRGMTTVLMRAQIEDKEETDGEASPDPYIQLLSDDARVSQKRLAANALRAKQAKKVSSNNKAEPDKESEDSNRIEVSNILNIIKILIILHYYTSAVNTSPTHHHKLLKL